MKDESKDQQEENQEVSDGIYGCLSTEKQHQTRRGRGFRYNILTGKYTAL